MKTCNNCGGRGKKQTIGKKKCLYCMGTGRSSQSIYPPQICRYCNGKGSEIQIYYITCNSCYGTGKLP